MHIEILTEDKSGAVVVERLVKRLLKQNDFEADVAVRPHRGCGSLPKDWDSRPEKFESALLNLLPAKCRAYNKVYGGTDTILVVIMDSDDKDPDELRRELYLVCKKYARNIRSVVGLCTEEIEAWLLGDIKAIMKAYPDSDIKIYEEYVQDSICGTWEMLCKTTFPETYENIIDIGYPAIGHYKARWAEAISLYMEPDNNVSPSFITFKNALLTALKDASPIPEQPVRPGVRRISF
ncbi:MAG: hypothetical protein J6127_08215 [Clostridiales bacterium]|nr:hypothetical protein [Clostridiales bacterium]